MPETRASQKEDHGDEPARQPGAHHLKLRANVVGIAGPASQKEGPGESHPKGRHMQWLHVAVLGLKATAGTLSLRVSATMEDDDGSSVAPTIIDRDSDEDDDADVAQMARVTSDDEDDDGDDGIDDDDYTFVDQPCVDAYTLAEFAAEPGVSTSFLEGQTLTCGNILHHCKCQVDAVRLDFGGAVCVFKIGITCAPIQRFRFYRAENFESMTLLHASVDYNVTNMLEAALIGLFWVTRGCRNINRGGEGNIHLRPPPYFTYIVAARADGRVRIGA